MYCPFKDEEDEEVEEDDDEDVEDDDEGPLRCSLTARNAARVLSVILTLVNKHFKVSKPADNKESNSVFFFTAVPKSVNDRTCKDCFIKGSFASCFKTVPVILGPRSFNVAMLAKHSCARTGVTSFTPHECCFPVEIISAVTFETRRLFNILIVPLRFDRSFFSDQSIST